MREVPGIELTSQRLNNRLARAIRRKYGAGRCRREAHALARSYVDTKTVDTDMIKPMGSRRAHDRPFEWHYSIEVPGFAETSGKPITVRPRVRGTKSTGLLEMKEPRADTDEFDITLWLATP